MSTLIPEISFTRFKKLKASDIRELQSFTVTSDGMYLMTVVVPRTDYVETQTEFLAQLSNSVGGKEIRESELVEV
tara:strand:- start:1414 stop:1638 length:225 start_codon:yes stop_codon:yes gene_type:complete